MDGGAVELREAHRLAGHADRVWALAWNPAPGPGAGPLLASCGGDKTVRIWKRAPDGAWHCSVNAPSRRLLLSAVPGSFDFRWSPPRAAACGGFGLLRRD
jgi:WD40 repeat protein